MKLDQFDVEAEFYIALDESEVKGCHLCGSTINIVRCRDVSGARGVEDWERIAQERGFDPDVRVGGFIEPDGTFYECLNCMATGMYGAGAQRGAQEVMRMMGMGGMGGF